MNRLYRLVFNHALKTVQVVSEIVTGSRPGRSPSPAHAPSLSLRLLVPALALACAGTAQAAAPAGWNKWGVGNSINWFQASNWSGGVPTATSAAAYIDGFSRVELPNAVSNHLHVGYEGSGRLEVFNGGTLTSSTIFMATEANSMGEAAISGPGSIWRSNTTIGVGHQGTGIVTITDQGTLQIGTDSYIGATETGNGTVNGIGDGSLFATAGNLLVGNQGEGMVRMQLGADMTSGSAYIGNIATGKGTVEINGTGSTWVNRSSMVIGSYGTGTVKVQQGGSVSAGASIWLGRFPAGATRSSGTLIVDGPGSEFIGSDMMVVGGSGDGSVQVSNGGRVDIAGSVVIAEQVGSTGTVSVSGTGSAWHSSYLRVGANGDAQFSVTDGATARVDTTVEVGLTASSKGVLTIGNNAVLRVGDGTSGRIIPGQGDSSLVMNGGTLQGNGALQVSTKVNLQGSGTLASDNAVDVWGTVSGAGLLTKTGTGTLTMNGNNTHTGGMRILDGRLVLGTATAAGTGTLTMADATALAFGLNTMAVGNAIRLDGAVNVDLGANQSVQLSGAIDDSSVRGRLVKTGAGRLTLSAANSYSGGTQVDAGTLAVATTGAAGTGEVNLANGTTLAFTGSAVALGNAVVLDGSSTIDVALGTGRLTGVVADGNGIGSLVKTGAGVLALEAANTLSGGVQVQGGGLLLGNDKAAGSGQVSLANGTILGVTRTGLDVANAITVQGTANVLLDNGRDARLSGVISNGAGTGRLVKSGTGMLTLAGSNTYTGGTTISGGTLKIERGDALGSGAVQIGNGASLGLAGNMVAVANDISLAGTTGMVVWPGSAELTGVISDGGSRGTLVKSGAGTLVLSAANRFSGGVQVGLGTLALGNASAAGSGTLAMNDYTTLAFSRSGLDIANDLLLGDHVTVRTDDATQLSGSIGDVTGNGRLVKTGAGTLTLSGTNTYSGGTQLDAGTLAVTGSSALGSGALQLADGTTLALAGSDVVLGNALALEGEGRIDVANGSATVNGVIRDGERSGGIIMMSLAVSPLAAPVPASGTLVKTGAGELVLGADSDYSGGTRIEAGRLRLQDRAAIAGDIAIAAGAGLDVARSADSRFSGVLSGAGEVRKLDAGQLWLTSDSHAFSGQTLISGGSLFVQGALGGATTLGATTLLGGTGTLQDVNLLDGASLAPGLAGGIGTLNVSGNLVFSQGARFTVDVAADGSSDWVHVGGTATLGNAGTVALARGSDWSPRTRYTLLTADQAVQGVFAGVTSNFAFLTPSLEYDANNVYLTLARNDIALPDVEEAFPDVKVNRNQKAVATSVEAMGTGNAVYDAVVRLEVDQVVPAFDSLSGEIHAANRGTLLQNRFLHDGIDRHLDGTVMAGEIAPGVRAWIAGSGGQRRTDASSENAGLRASQHGVMAGAGWQLGESLELGVAAGQQQLVSRLAQRDARSETDNTEYGLYAQYRWQGLSLRGGVSRADYRTDSTRTAQVGTTLSEGLVSREDATGTTAFVRAGWSFGGPRLQLTPELELAQVRLSSDGSQEHGGHSALQLDSSSATYRTGLAALRVDWDISGGQRDRAALTARVGWQAAGGDRLPQVDARFVEGTQGFAISAAPLARRSALAQFGVALSPTDNSRVALQMQGRRGDGQRDVGAQLDWSVAF